MSDNETEVTVAGRKILVPNMDKAKEFIEIGYDAEGHIVLSTSNFSDFEVGGKERAIEVLKEAIDVLENTATQEEFERIVQENSEAA